jgi:hypothetical protein
MKQPNVYIINATLLRVEDDILENIPFSRFGVSLDIIDMMDLIVITNDDEFHVFKNKVDGTTNTQAIEDLPDFVTDFVSRWSALSEEIEEYYERRYGDEPIFASIGFGHNEDDGGQ